jgi:hypothetical protein
VLGLLAMMLVGSVTAGAAWAEAGPFWHHRAIGTEGEGAKVEPSAPENFSGSGGKQVLTGEPASGEIVELTSAATQVKGAIFNGEHQGQIKLVVFYQKPEVKLNNVAKPECKASVGQQGQFSNIVQLKGHLAWKWDGTKSQLEELPQKEQTWDIVFTQTEPQRQSTTGFPLLDLRGASGVFAEVHFEGSTCGVLNGTNNKVAGAEVGIPSPSGLGSFSRNLNVRTIASATLPAEVLETKVGKVGFLQHIWVGTGYQPLVLGLTLTGNPASLVGQTETQAAQQEIAVFEK